MNFACVLYSFNRPSYLDQTLTSLEANIPCKWYFLQDGAVTPGGRRVAADEDIQACLRRLEASPLGGEVFFHGENVGITWQFKTAFQLFSHYDYLFIFEDDMVVSKDYIQMVLNIATEYPAALLNAGWSRWGERFPDAPLNALVEGRTQLWGYWFPKEQYDFVKPTFEHFVEIVGKDHVGRPKGLLKRVFNSDNAAVDNLVGRTLWEAGFQRLTTVWPRGKYIGEEGLHMNPEKYAKKGFMERKWEWEGDAQRKGWEVIWSARK